MTKLSHPLLFIDLEASGLGEDSFPIELGWATLDGKSGSWLIRPEPDWETENWDPIAEELHGINREQLKTNGLTVWKVVSEFEALRLSIPQAAVVSDAIEYDRFWLDRLYSVSPFLRSFELTDFESMWKSQFSTSLPPHLETTARHHRAEADARRLRNFWKA